MLSKATQRILSRAHIPQIPFRPKLPTFNLFPAHSFKFSSVNDKLPGYLPDKKPTDFSSLMPQDVNPDIAKKVEALESSQPFFDRLVFFDPDFMATLPYFLERFDPVVEAGKDLIVKIHDSTGLPWWAVICLTCILARTTLMPLIYFQFKRTSKLASIIPVVTQIKKVTDKSKLPKYKKWFLFSKVTFRIVRKQNLKSLRLVVYNLCHFPLLITIIWTIRRLLVVEGVKNQSLLWVPSLCAIDPYYIIPSITVACYYWNLGRFITKENQHTLISRLKSFGQILVILWLPILCNWPSAIALYMLTNAVFSIVQTSLLVSPEFYRRVDPKMVLHQFIIRIVEYDKAQSEALVDAIKTGEETTKDKSIKEEILVENMKITLRQLETQKFELHKEDAEQANTQTNISNEPPQPNK